MKNYVKKECHMKRHFLQQESSLRALCVCQRRKESPRGPIPQRENLSDVKPQSIPWDFRDAGLCWNSICSPGKIIARSCPLQTGCSAGVPASLSSERDTSQEQALLMGSARQGGGSPITLWKLYILVSSVFLYQQRFRS